MYWYIRAVAKCHGTDTFLLSSKHGADTFLSPPMGRTFFLDAVF